MVGAAIRILVYLVPTSILPFGVENIKVEVGVYDAFIFDVPNLN